MRRCVGYVESHGKRLKYYVFGNRRDGFGVEITETYVEEAEQVVTQSLDIAMSLAQQLRRGSVFPANLTEILEDLDYHNVSD